MSTFDTLLTVYRNVRAVPTTGPADPSGVQIPADDLAQLQLMATSIDAMKAGYFAVWSYTAAVEWILDSAKTTSSIAALTVGFLADHSVNGAGLGVLVSGPDNPWALTSDYYRGMSLENRYISFSVWIAKQTQPALTKFTADYSDLTLLETLKKAYGAIFQTTKTDAEFQALLSPERVAYFAAYGGEDSSGLGTKAALIGWLLGEAAKINAGPYVEAARNLLRDIAGDGDAHLSAHFLETWGKGGAYAPGGAADPGLPGDTVVIQHDWDVTVNKAMPSDDVHAVATAGDDVITNDPTTSGPSLSLGRTVATGSGNDTIAMTGGPMRGHIDAGSGNDVIIIDQIDGKVTTGVGYDTVQINGFAPLTTIEPASGAIVPTAIITDLHKGFDTVDFAASLGQGVPVVIATLLPVDTLQEMLTLVAYNTEAGRNAVFEWNGDTYIYHQNDRHGLDQGDGLIQLVGVTGLKIGNGAEAGDINFGRTSIST